jgi:hypothetical protein
VTAALLLVVAAASPLAAPSTPPSAPVLAGVPALEVSGAVSLADENTLEVRVDLTNRGGPSGPVTIDGELAGGHDEAKVASGIGTGEIGSAVLHFPRAVPRPGVHPLVLLLDYSPRAPVAGAPAALSQRAFLLLSLGAAPPPPVRLSAPELGLRDRGLLRVSLQSADGAAHRVRLRVLGPRGLNAEHAVDEVAVPATGSASVTVPLLRGGVPRPSRQGVLLVAETLDGALAQASAATTVVDVAAPADLTPHLRVPFIVIAALLLAAAAVLEWRHLRQAHRASADQA